MLGPNANGFAFWWNIDLGISVLSVLSVLWSICVCGVSLYVSISQ